MFRIFARNISANATTTNSLLQREIYQENTVVRLVLNDGKVNALSLALIDELLHELTAIDKIKKVRSVIVAHHGPAFSAGHQLKELRTDQGTEAHNKVFDRCTEMMTLIQRMKVPVIAEVNGTAAAAGCQLVAACDLVVAGKSSQFLVPGQRVGLFCSTPGIPLARNIPSKVALDMLLTGEPINAETALRAGLISRLVEDSEVRVEALKVAEQIGRYSRSVTALGKGFFYAQKELSTADAYRYGSKVMVGNLKLKDCQEGINAFLEKRHPEFEGTDELVEQKQ